MKSQTKKHQKVFCKTESKIVKNENEKDLGIHDLCLFLEMQTQKGEYEKSTGFSGEKKLFYKSEKTDEFYD